MPCAAAHLTSTWSYPTAKVETISSFGSFPISSGPILSDDTLTAMARTRGPISFSSASRSLASASRCTVNGASPLTMVGFGGPASRTSIFPSVMAGRCSAIEPGQRDAHQHDTNGVEDDLLEGDAKRHRRDHVIDQVDRNDRKARDRDA